MKTWEVLIYAECPNTVLAYWRGAIGEVERTAINGRHGHLSMENDSKWTEFTTPRQVTKAMLANLTRQCERRVEYLKTCVRKVLGDEVMEWFGKVATKISAICNSPHLPGTDLTKLDELPKDLVDRMQTAMEPARGELLARSNQKKLEFQEARQGTKSDRLEAMKQTPDEEKHDVHRFKWKGEPYERLIRDVKPGEKQYPKGPDDNLSRIMVEARRLKDTVPDGAELKLDILTGRTISHGRGKGMNRVKYNVMAFTSPVSLFLTLKDGAMTAVRVEKGEIILVPYTMQKWIAELATKNDRMVFAKWSGGVTDDREAEL